MFPEYRQLITQLKSENISLFQRHNALDQQIQNMEAGIVPASGNDVEVLKKEKLQLKDNSTAYSGRRRTRLSGFTPRAGHDACPALFLS